MPFIKRQTPYTPREERGNYAPIPAGWYRARIDKADVAPKHGKLCASLAFAVVGGEHAGRLVFEDFWLHTSGCRPRSIQTLRNIVDDLGLEYTGTDEELLNDIFQIANTEVEVKVKVERQEGYEPRNRLVDTAAVGTHTQGAPAPRVVPSPAAPAQTPTAPAGDAETPPF